MFSSNLVFKNKSFSSEGLDLAIVLASEILGKEETWRWKFCFLTLASSFIEVCVPFRCCAVWKEWCSDSGAYLLILRIPLLHIWEALWALVFLCPCKRATCFVSLILETSALPWVSCTAAFMILKNAPQLMPQCCKLYLSLEYQQAELSIGEEHL